MATQTAALKHRIAPFLGGLALGLSSPSLAAWPGDGTGSHEPNQASTLRTYLLQLADELRGVVEYEGFTTITVEQAALKNDEFIERLKAAPNNQYGLDQLTGQRLIAKEIWKARLDSSGQRVISSMSAQSLGSFDRWATRKVLTKSAFAEINGSGDRGPRVYEFPSAHPTYALLDTGMADFPVLLAAAVANLGTEVKWQEAGVIEGDPTVVKVPIGRSNPLRAEIRLGAKYPEVISMPRIDGSLVRYELYHEAVAGAPVDVGMVKQFRVGVAAPTTDLDAMTGKRGLGKVVFVTAKRSITAADDSWTNWHTYAPLATLKSARPVYIDPNAQPVTPSTAGSSAAVPESPAPQVAKAIVVPPLSFVRADTSNSWWLALRWTCITVLVGGAGWVIYRRTKQA